MGRTPPAPRARRRKTEQSPRRQSPSTRVALNATGTNVEIHTTPTKREPEDGPKSSFHLRPPVGSAMSAWGQQKTHAPLETNVTRLCAPQPLICHVRNATHQVHAINTISHEAADLDELPKWVDCRDMKSGGEVNNHFTVGNVLWR